MDFTPEDIRKILISVLVLLISVALHEFGHAFMADKLGDDTPRRQGRVTLNPLAHADPIGTLLLPLLSAASGMGGFGWGKPVQWQPNRVTRKISLSAAKILVSVAGPGMNLLLAVVLACVHASVLALDVLSPSSEINKFLLLAVRFNFILFFFNLLPVPPLDGGHVAQSFLPYRYRDRFDGIAKYAPFLLLALMLTPQLQVVFVWPAQFLTKHLYHLLGVL